MNPKENEIARVGDILSKVQSQAEQARLKSQMEAAAAKQAADNEERILMRYCTLVEERAKAERAFEGFKKSCQVFTGKDVEREAIRDLAGALLSHGESAIQFEMKGAVTHWARTHEPEIIKAGEDLTVGAVQRQMDKLMEEGAAVLIKHGLLNPDGTSGKPKKS